MQPRVKLEGEKSRSELNQGS